MSQASQTVFTLNPAQYVKAVDQLRKGFIAQFTKVIKADFKAEQNKLFKTATSNTVEGKADQIINNVDRFYDPTIVYERMYVAVYPVLAEREFDKLLPSKNMGRGFERKGSAEQVAEWERAALQFVADDLGSMITAVEAFSHDVVVRHTRAIAEKAVKQGWGTGKFASALRADLDTLDLMRSIRIARTEILTAASVGTHAGAVSTGLKLSKTWLTVPGNGGDRHGEDIAYSGLNNQTVGRDELFTLTAGITAQTPHDISLPGSERINCVCSHLYTPI